MPGEAEPAAGVDEAGSPAGGRPAFDTTVAHSARVHNYWLGGQDHFAADLVNPGLVPVQAWRPGSEFEATARSAMWGGVARKP